MKFTNYLLSFLLAAPLAFAGPGAHGPNGEHLDEAGSHTHSEAGPRIETFTETFELVGRLQGEELSILIDRYDTNEPVLNGKLEVEYKGIKAPATFHADHGDYSVDDARLLKALAEPGKHPLIFTLSAGDDSDLLEGTLETAAHTDEHDHEHEHEHGPVSKWIWVAGAAAALIGAAIVFMRRRRNKSTGTQNA